jgi:regulator of sigma E protease
MSIMRPIHFLWSIPVFGILIFIHELGHFSVAKAFGIRVKEFALGFGPVVTGFRRGETRYNLRLVPLGGFVLMGGMEEGEDDDPRGYLRKPVFARFLTILAGPMMNFLLAVVILAGYFATVPSHPSTTLGQVQERCGAVTCPAYQAGLRVGDKVLAINGTPVTTWDDVLALVGNSNGKPLTFQVERAGAKEQIQVQPRQLDGQWRIGIGSAFERLPLGEAIRAGGRMTLSIIGLILEGLGKMITGTAKPDLQGPIGITRTIAESAQQGLSTLLTLTAYLSINLGLFNLLPIPALDGSRLIFLTVEGVRGRRIDPRRENMVHLVGFLLLLGLMVVTAYSDILRL